MRGQQCSVSCDTNWPFNDTTVHCTIFLFSTWELFCLMNSQKILFVVWLMQVTEGHLRPMDIRTDQSGWPELFISLLNWPHVLSLECNQCKWEVYFISMGYLKSYPVFVRLLWWKIMIYYVIVIIFLTNVSIQ